MLDEVSQRGSGKGDKVASYPYMWKLYVYMYVYGERGGGTRNAFLIVRQLV